jgi:hypothetical protein
VDRDRLGKQAPGYVALESTRAEHGFPCVAKVSTEGKVEFIREQES